MRGTDLSGAILFRGEEYLTQAVATGSRRLVLRGLAMREDAVAVGFSAWARREERMTVAGGGVILFRDGKLVGLVDGPFGQVFDILPVNGARTDAARPCHPCASLLIGVHLRFHFLSLKRETDAEAPSRVRALV